MNTAGDTLGGVVGVAPTAVLKPHPANHDLLRVYRSLLLEGPASMRLLLERVPSVPRSRIADALAHMHRKRDVLVEDGVWSVMSERVPVVAEPVPEVVYEGVDLVSPIPTSSDPPSPTQVELVTWGDAPLPYTRVTASSDTPPLFFGGPPVELVERRGRLDTPRGEAFVALTIPALIALAGLLVYVLVTNAKASELGRISFAVGLLVVLLHVDEIRRILIP